MRVGIVGWFGSDNLGDEILLHCLLTGVRSVVEDASFIVFCPDPGRVTELHGVDGQRLPTLRARGAVRRHRGVRRGIGTCDVLLLGPGTVFQERSPNLPWPGTLPLFARVVAMARLAGTPVAVVGAGVREGGTPVGHVLVRMLGAACLAVGVRDRRSASYFGPSAQVIGDMAYTLPLPEVTIDHRDRSFALSLRPLTPELQHPLVAAVGVCADELRREGWSAVFFPMAHGRGARGEDDRSVYHRLRRDSGGYDSGGYDSGGYDSGGHDSGGHDSGGHDSGGHDSGGHDSGGHDAMSIATSPLHGRVPLAAALDGWLAGLAAHRLMIATRLHAALLAVALGVPTVAIAYEQKVRETFVDLELARFVVDPDVDGRSLHRVATAAAASREEFQHAATRIADRAALTREFLASVLSRVA